MIYLKFIPVILYLVEAFVPPLDGTNDTIDEAVIAAQEPSLLVDFNNLNSIDVQNSLNDKGTSNTPKL